MRRIVILSVCALALLAACSSGKKKSSPTTTTTTTAETSTTTTSTGTETTTTTAPVTTTTASQSATTTTIANTSSVKITGFTYIGDNPVVCNAPTQVELKWNTSGATKVVLAIDGDGAFANYPNGPKDALFPLSCDGKTHTYKLTASSGARSATSSISVTTQKSS